MTTPQPTNSIYILEEHKRVEALRADLASTAPAHAPGTYWHDSRKEELALCEQRLARLEALEPALP